MSILTHILIPAATLFAHPHTLQVSPHIDRPLHRFALRSPRVGTRSPLRHGMRAAPPVQSAPRVFTVADSYAALHQAALRWGVSEPWLDRVAMCESGMSPTAYNPSGASGLMQWMPSSYWALAKQIGESRSYWDAHAAANVAGYAFSRGLASMWVCR